MLGGLAQVEASCEAISSLVDILRFITMLRISGNSMISGNGTQSDRSVDLLVGSGSGAKIVLSYPVQVR